MTADNEELGIEVLSENRSDNANDDRLTAPMRVVALGAHTGKPDRYAFVSRRGSSFPRHTGVCRGPHDSQEAECKHER